MSPIRALVAAVATLAMIGLVIAFTASNKVAPSTAGAWTQGTNANNIKPASCSWTLNATPVTGSGTITGTGGNDLILGSSGSDTIKGGGGRDCILGGGGNDTITGNTKVHGKKVINAGDFCDGGPGTDHIKMASHGNQTPVASCDTYVNATAP